MATKVSVNYRISLDSRMLKVVEEAIVEMDKFMNEFISINGIEKEIKKDLCLKLLTSVEDISKEVLGKTLKIEVI